jgi:hypothetical protein
MFMVFPDELVWGITVTVVPVPPMFHTAADEPAASPLNKKKRMPQPAAVPIRFTCPAKLEKFVRKSSRDPPRVLLTYRFKVPEPATLGAVQTVLVLKVMLPSTPAGTKTGFEKAEV